MPEQLRPHGMLIVGFHYMYISYIVIILQLRDEIDLLLQNCMIIHPLIIHPQLKFAGNNWKHPVCLSLCLSLCLSVCLSVHNVCNYSIASEPILMKLYSFVVYDLRMCIKKDSSGQISREIIELTYRQFNSVWLGISY